MTATEVNIQELEFNRIKEDQTSMQMQQCTFHPNINPIPSQRTSTPVVDRYAIQYTFARFLDYLHLCRLYVDYKPKFRVWEQERQRKEDEEFERTCTFKPQTNTTHSKRASTPTRSSTPSTSSKDVSPPKSSYSFAPVVNKIKTNILVR